LRFLDPDAGEMLDRLSVLARKRLEKPDRAHFEEEERALIAHWGARTMVLNAQMLPQVLRLAAVNMAIWETETDIRCARQDEAEQRGAEHSKYNNTLCYLGVLAMRLQRMNEERARLVQFFNEKLGMGAVEEKDFAL
jgi:hypothetical protein